ncbi:MAG: GGDEF domain-containing protein [Pseudomonadota bacterium]
MEPMQTGERERPGGGDNRRRRLVITGLLLVPVLGVIDYLTGKDLSFSIFYVASVYLAAWFGGVWFGAAASLGSSFTWLAADLAGGMVYPHIGYALWNMTVRLGFFIIITMVLWRLKKALEREKRLAGEDPLTGAANRRRFVGLMRMEIYRAQRYGRPLTVAYIDLDNFKEINDSLGHAAGDEVIIAVARNIKKNTRKIDVVARYGGDEFVVLLPETGADAAKPAVEKIRAGLENAMRLNGWPITFSIGAVTSTRPPDEPDAVIMAADNLMYDVKNSGKNGAWYKTLDGDGFDSAREPAPAAGMEHGI